MRAHGTLVLSSNPAHVSGNTFGNGGNRKPRHKIHLPFLCDVILVVLV